MYGSVAVEAPWSFVLCGHCSEYSLHKDLVWRATRPTRNGLVIIDPPSKPDFTLDAIRSMCITCERGFKHVSDQKEV